MKEQRKTYYEIGIVAVFVFLVVHYWDGLASGIGSIGKALLPLLFGAALAYCLNILMSFYERHFFPKSKNAIVRKIARPVCILGAVLTLLLVVLLALMLMASEIRADVNRVVAEVSDTARVFVTSFLQSDLVPESLIKTLKGIDWENITAEITAVVGVLSGVAGRISNAVGRVSGAVEQITDAANGVKQSPAFDFRAYASVAPTVINFAFSLIFSVCFLMNKERILARGSQILNTVFCPTRSKTMRHGLDVANDSFHSYIVRRCIKAVIVGAFCAVGLLILRFPYAITIGVLVGLTGLFPIIGTFAGGAVGFIVIMTVKTPGMAVLFLVFLIALHLLESRVLYPKMVHTVFDLSFTWTLAAVSVGGGVLGFPGMAVSVPTMAAVRQLGIEAVEKRAQERSAKEAA